MAEKKAIGWQLLRWDFLARISSKYIAEPAPVTLSPYGETKAIKAAFR
jgi:hypothetical protein